MSRRRSRDAEVIILGGGLCGLSAAYHLKGGWRIFEAEGRVGGLARSERIRGHTFDQTGHWLHLRDPGMTRLARRLLGDELVRVARRSRIFSHGVLTRYPFQANLHGLPPEVVFQCLRGFLDREALTEARLALCAEKTQTAGSTGGRAKTPRTFEDLIYRAFGPGIAEHFMVPYNEKLWGVHPRELSDAWCQRFVPFPSRDEVLRGAVGATPPDLGYNVSFLYPREGGIELLARGIQNRLDARRIHCGAKVEAIDHRGRRVRVGEEWHHYSALVATAPLPVLCGLLVAPPVRVARAAQKLRWTSVTYLNLGLKRRPPQDYHWVYVPERRWPAYRVGVFSNAVPAAAPPRGGSLYVELASRGSEDTDTLLRQCLPLLVAAGALRSPEDLRFGELRTIEHAYVIFDEAYAEARTTLLDFFESADIYPRGRYGSWTYGSMEDALVEGREVAKLIRSQYKRSPDERS